MKALGRHLLAEFYDCDTRIINDVKLLETIMKDAVLKIGATIVNVSFHTFNPHGVSGFIVIAESHLAVHTWPEYNFASIDIYTCGETINPWEACNYIAEKLRSKHVSAIEMKRGVLDIPGKKIQHKPIAEEVSVV